MKGVSRLLLVPLAVALAACGDATGHAISTVTDSAGVQIVTSTAPAWKAGEAWLIDTTPMLDIGGSDTDPHYDLLSIAGIAQLQDGRIAVLTAGSSQVRFYDATGTWLTSVGREGAGPGEFRGAFQMLRGAGDTLFVFDYQLRRMSRLGPDGAFLPSLPSPEQGGLVFPFALLRDGSWAASGAVTFGGDGQAGLVRPEMPVVHLRPDLVLADTVVVLRGPEAWVEIANADDGSRTVGMRTLPLGLSSSYAASDSLIYAGEQDRYQIGVYRPDGTLVRSIRRVEPRRDVTNEMLARVKRDELADASDRDAALARWNKTPKASALPAFADFGVDAAGDLWVLQAKVLRSDTSFADVYDPSGIWLGTVTLPLGFSLFDATSDRVVGLWRDDVGREHVRMYGVRKVGQAD